MFKRVTAPFDGVVTVRNTDVGALINADSSVGLALFVVSDFQKLRLLVSVPQNYVPAVKINTKVQVAMPEHPGKVYNATVEASARTVDPASGTTRMQLAVDNSAGEPMPGAFASMHIELPEDLPALSIPAGALIFGEHGLRVTTVDAAGKATLKIITIARDLGQIVEIGTGIARDDRIINSPPNGLADGDQVRVFGPPPAGTKG